MQTQRSSTAPQFTRLADQWRRCREAIEGQDAVHLAGERYLPRLTGQNLTDYQAYLRRSPYYNATARTLHGLTGMVFRKPPQIVAPPSMAGIVADMTIAPEMPEDAARVAAETLREVLSVGRVAWLVEYPSNDGVPVTEAQAQAENRRPYLTRYATESIVDWRYERRANAAQLTMVKLAESVTLWGPNFTRQEIQQERWLYLDAKTGAYTQQVYRDGKPYGEPMTPLMQGAPMGFIPFVGVCASGMGLDDAQPPLLDLVDTNLSHYRTSADLEHGAHFTGLPTPVLIGATIPEGERIPIGSTHFLALPNPDSDAKYLEFTGTGLGALERLRDAKEAQMAALGARMLASEKRAAEAAETLQIRHNGESSVLAQMAGFVGKAVTRCLQIMRDWQGLSGEVSVTLSTDYYAPGLGAQELLALVDSWQRGAISGQTLFDNLQRGEIVAPGVTYEDEQERIASQAPSGDLTAPSS